MIHIKKTIITPLKFLLVVLGIIIFISFLWEERQPYEVLHSTVMSSPNLTETQITIVIHSFLPVDREALAEEIVKNHLKLNGGNPNPYFELEIYRTMIHYKLHLPYDTILCNESGEIVTKIVF